MWTLEELVDRVGAALSTEYPGAPNGRVRDLPDRRAVRWYATTGLVDRPAAMRGRTALYGRRHLLQLVALKRRQAAGRTLAQIQAELAGATDATLATIARIPEHLLAPAPVDSGPVDSGPVVAARPRFWADVPAAPQTAPPTAAPAMPLTTLPLTGLPLGGGVVLLMPGRPDAGDCAAIADAARPLLALLAERGLAEPGPAERGHRAPPTDRSSS